MISTLQTHQGQHSAVTRAVFDEILTISETILQYTPSII